MELEDEEWELCNDEGFVYKRKRRRLNPAAEASSTTAEADALKQRRERKRQILLKLKAKYEKEINEWDSLSSSLRSMQQHTAALELQRERALEQTKTKTPSSLASTSSTDSVGGSLLDELLLQVEAQEAIIHDISHLCDEAEAICSKREEQFNQSLFDLPIWASPLELMKVLCDD